MESEIKLLLSGATDPDQVGHALQAACATFGTVVKTGVTFTGQERQPHRITGIVEMDEPVAPHVAKRLGAECLGTRLVVFRYPAPDEV